MKWEEFEREKELYLESWERLKDEFSGDARKFLNKSYVVILFNRCKQFRIENTVVQIVTAYPYFFIEDDACKKLTELVSQYKKAGKSTCTSKEKY